MKNYSYDPNRLELIQTLLNMIPQCDDDTLEGLVLLLGASQLGGLEGKALLQETKEKAAALSGQIEESIKSSVGR